MIKTIKLILLLGIFGMVTAQSIGVKIVTTSKDDMEATFAAMLREMVVLTENMHPALDTDSVIVITKVNISYKLNSPWYQLEVFCRTPKKISKSYIRENFLIIDNKARLMQDMLEIQDILSASCQVARQLYINKK